MSNLLVKNGKVIGGIPIASENLKLLWENPDPTQTFAAQTISLSKDDYDFLLWIVRNSTSDNYDYSNISKKSDSSILSMCTWDGKSVYRSVTRSTDTSFLVDNCLYAGSQSNDLCIPLAIYGIYKHSIATTEASKCMLSDGVTSVESALMKKITINGTTDEYGIGRVGVPTGGTVIVSVVIDIDDGKWVSRATMDVTNHNGAFILQDYTGTVLTNTAYTGYAFYV